MEAFAIGRGMVGHRWTVDDFGGIIVFEDKGFWTRSFMSHFSDLSKGLTSYRRLMLDIDDLC
jgi:hypothetical protein